MGGWDGNDGEMVPTVEVFKALAHPIRIQILAYLGSGTPRSMNDISRRVGVAVARARFHILALLEAGLVLVVERGGGVKRYSVREPGQIPAVAWNDLPDIVRTALTSDLIGSYIRDQDEAQKGGPAGLGQAHLSMTPLEVDMPGAEAVRSRLDETQNDLLAIQEESRARLQNTEKRAAVLITAAILCF